MKKIQIRKRAVAAGMSLLLVAGLLSPGTAPLTARAAGKTFAYTYKKVTVRIGGPAKKLIKKAGKPVKKKVKNFILYTYSHSEKGPEYINGITFLTSKVSTKKGIRIGSSYSKVKRKYGKGKNSFAIYTYKKGKSKLQIEITDNKVTNIRYIKAK